MSDDNELSLLLLDEGNDVVKTVLESDGLFGLEFLTFNLSFGGGVDTSLLFLGGFRAVLVEHTEDLNSEGLVEGVVELVDERRNLKTVVEDGTSTLDADITRPLDVASKVTVLVEGERALRGSGEHFRL